MTPQKQSVRWSGAAGRCSAGIPSTTVGLADRLAGGALHLHAIVLGPDLLANGARKLSGASARDAQNLADILAYATTSHKLQRIITSCAL